MKLWIITTGYAGSTFPRVFDSEEKALAVLFSNESSVEDGLDIRTLNANDPLGEEHQQEQHELWKRIRERQMEQSHASKT
jgi:uncharacterized protein YvpB